MTRPGSLAFATVTLFILNGLGALAGIRTMTSVEFMIAVFIAAWCGESTATNGAGGQHD